MTTSVFNKRPDTKITYMDDGLSEQINNGPYCCFIGPNNSGKSYLLKTLSIELGDKAAYLGPARYNNFNALPPYAPQPKRRREQHRNFRRQFNESNQNLDNSPFNIQQAIAEFDNDRRNVLFEIVKKVLGASLSLDLAHPKNEMSQRFISCDEHNLSFASSGTRLVVSIITSLLDTEYSHFLIDEPELGVSPKSQGQLADFILDESMRRKYFSHIKSIIFASHSSLFLDRKNISNNFVVKKSGNEIQVNRINSLAEFNQIHFSLLGNRLESLFLPSVIIFVEGPTEEKYISRILQVKYPSLSASIINATNDSEMKRYAHMMAQLFPDLQRSPYNGRIIAILDSVHGTGIVDTLIKKGISEDMIVRWSKNGIEHYYPEDIMRDIFGGNGPISIIGDEVTMCGVMNRKLELSEKIAARIREDTRFPDEMERKLFPLLDGM
ncbi:ATP-dependent nuclease [Paralimibaculum aggregatum]|uniref:ATP-dependent nuclease n=1 Tax=Paralimibaculum aggregatum TaxID=3036245 RepID=UPI002553F088|nr:AAA family ATPase [Limibaculum sp. NKW23]